MKLAKQFYFEPFTIICSSRQCLLPGPGAGQVRCELRKQISIKATGNFANKQSARLLIKNKKLLYLCEINSIYSVVK
jgi:hypothetical protein